MGFRCGKTIKCNICGTEKECTITHLSGKHTKRKIETCSYRCSLIADGRTSDVQRFDRHPATTKDV